VQNLCKNRILQDIQSGKNCEQSYKSKSPVAKHYINTVMLASRLVEPNSFPVVYIVVTT